MGIDWRKSQARKLILYNLENGLLSLEEEEESAEKVWEFYKNMPEFVSDGVIFSQFKERLKSHRNQVKTRKESTNRDEEALSHDRKLYPQRHAIIEVNLCLIVMMQNGYYEQMWRESYDAIATTVFSSRVHDV